MNFQSTNKGRRSTDGIVGTLGRFWDWIDERDIDKHAVSLVILLGTVEVLRWAMAYAGAHADKSGADIGLTIASVTAPYMALQAAALSFYFKART
jgi:UDP-N-acetylglucosamine enolpyruvyl transferase